MKIFMIFGKSIKRFFSLKFFSAIYEWRHWKALLDTAVALSTVFTLIIVFWTLKEMQIQRDRAYAPFIIVENTQVHVAWSGYPSDGTPVKKNPFINEDDIENSLFISLNIRNIGVEVAKNICISINIENLIYNMVDGLDKKTGYDTRRYKLLEDGDIFLF